MDQFSIFAPLYLAVNCTSYAIAANVKSRSDGLSLRGKNAPLISQIGDIVLFGTQCVILLAGTRASATSELMILFTLGFLVVLVRLQFSFLQYKTTNLRRLSRQFLTVSTTLLVSVIAIIFVLNQ